MALNIIKVDLDIENRDEVISLLQERIKFLDKLQILKKKNICEIELLKKSKYSVKIYTHNECRDEILLILIQSILGDDYKRTAITLRDFKANVRNWNRMFNIKRYPQGDFKVSINEIVTSEVL